MPEDVNTLDKRQFSTLVAIMAALRHPQHGCPWDLEQSFETITPYTIEEAYEVADAVARKNMTDLCEELGDLLLQPVYHAQLAKDETHFDIADVIEAVCTKMIRRHPHVFGNEAERVAPISKGFWEDAKAKEKHPQHGERTLDGVAMALPAATRAIKLQAKAAKVGFDWPDVSHVFDKVDEELLELKSAPAAERAEEYGDLLFAMVNIGRHYGLDPEASLRAANAKFERRFQFIEDALAQAGKQPAQSQLEEMDSLWNEAKKRGL